MVVFVRVWENVIFCNCKCDNFISKAIIKTSLQIYEKYFWLILITLEFTFPIQSHIFLFLFFFLLDPLGPLLFLVLIHPGERVLLLLFFLLLQWVMVREHIIVYKLLLFLHLLLFFLGRTALRLETELEVVELVKGVELFVADWDAIREDAFA